MTNDPSHERNSEQVFDYFLHELISGQSPPDLSRRITAAWSREQAQHTDPTTRSRSASGSSTVASSTGPAAKSVAAQSITAQSITARPVRAPSAIAPATDSALANVTDQPFTAARPVVARPIHSGFNAQGADTQGSTADDSVQSAAVSHGIPLRRQIVAALLATGACGLLTLLSWQLIDPDRGLTQRVLELARSELRNMWSPPLASPAQPAADSASPSLASGSPASSNSAERATNSPAVAASSPQTPASTKESIAQFPLDRHPGASRSPRADALQVGTGDSPTEVVASVLDSHQIVAQIDQRLAHVWQELSVTPSPKMSELQRAQKVSLVLTGLPPSGIAGDLDALISEATASLPFARQWADQFVGVWLAGSNLPADDARVQTLKKHFAEYIYEGRPWNATALELLGGPLSVSPPAGGGLENGLENGLVNTAQSLAKSAEPPTPGAGLNPIASAFVSALAGDGNHRLVSHIGTNFLDVDLACARCHDVNSSSLAARWSDTALDAEPAAGRQAMYWSLTAMLQGVDAIAAEGGQRIVVDRQSELLAAGKQLTAYYDLIDGRLQAAEPRLPNGQPWEMMVGADVPRQALAEWLSQSPAMDEATVNQVWCMIFGQPLVSRTPVSLNKPTADEVLATGLQSAESQQRELLELLSTQFRAHGHDLKQLVAWVVRSDAFRRQLTRPTHAQWLAASQDELRQWQITRASFASGAKPADAANNRSLETSLTLILQWRERSSTGAETALAQPVPNFAAIPTLETVLQAPASTAAGSMDSSPADESKDRLRLTPPSAAELAFVDRLLTSQRLSWEDCVEHIVCLTPELLPDNRIQVLADELLRQHKGDARAALLDLLWAVKR